MEIRFQVISIGSRFAILQETFGRDGHREAKILEQRFDTRQQVETELEAITKAE